MPSLDEAATGKNQLAGGLAQGVDTLSLSQTITFTKYVKVVLPLDGFVFWVKADQLTPGALYNANTYNQFAYNEATDITPAATVDIKGSLHYSTRTDQKEDETAAVNYVIFTALSSIVEFNEIGANVLFIGEFEGIRFAFNERAPFYKQADLHHYRGTAIMPAMETQIVDDPRSLDITNVVVSNSLPAWLALNKLAPMYPSFLVDNNLRPPYIAVHIDPNKTRAIQSVPRITKDSTHYQLAQDTVRLTMYGLRNDAALDFQDYLFTYMRNYDVLGLLSMPIIRDEKRTQSEMSVLGIKKTFEVEVSYYQARMRKIARQLILSAFLNLTITE